MVAMSDKTVLALLLVFVTGRAKEGKDGADELHFEAKRAVDCMVEFLWEMPIEYD
jgi:hypothetical protein